MVRPSTGVAGLSSKISEQIRLLRELQEVDRQIREIERAKSDLPLRRANLRAARERGRADIENAKSQLTRNDEERRRLEKEVAFDMDALKRFETRSQEVTGPDAFNAAARELDTRKKSVREKEDLTVRLMEEREVLVKKAAQLEQDFAVAEKTYSEEEKVLEAQNAEVDQKTSGLRQQRAEMAKNIEKGLLSRYDAVFKRRDGLAIVAVRAEVCQGCDMGVPPQIANFARSGEMGVQSCPHCGRILVWEPRDAPKDEGAAKPKRARKTTKKAAAAAEDADDAPAEAE